MIQRGEIYLVNLTKNVGSEQGGIRPAVIIQNDKGNISFRSDNEDLASATWHYNTCYHRYDNSCDLNCNKCGAVRTVKHEYKIIGAKDPTCTANGYTGDKVCSICKKVDYPDRSAD